jgi:DNA-binding transcriptional ArsR family regulator
MLTCARSDCRRGGGVLTSARLLALLAAVGHPQRLRIIAELAGGQVHVSELARRLGLSRPLVYMHLERLETAGLISGKLELSSSGKAMKYIRLEPFELNLTVDTILAALREDQTEEAAAPQAEEGHHDVKGASP